jgi:8-oxo-dGTP pyrophosphatase MutT (NUDIX family)
VNDEPIRREAARVAVIDAEERVLLLRVRDPARPAAGEWWELPGGGLVPGEIATTAARRELYEETGIVTEELGPRLAVVETDFSFDGKRYRQRETIFSLHVEREECVPAALEPGAERAAHVGHEWIPLASLRTRRLRLHPPQLARLLARFEP